YDGKMLNDGGRVALYSVAEATNLSIQARSAFVATDVVPMGFTALAAGQYTIVIDRKDGLFDEGQEIYLKDNLLGTVTSLEEAYTFTSEAGTFNGRFEVVYAASPSLGDDDHSLNVNSVMVFKQGNGIAINTGSASMNSVTIYDIRGRQLYTKSGINATETVVSGLQVEQQVLIVEVDTVKGKVSKRIIF
ncbi:T9SS sorting signal type C domain-containing protein, partial [Flavobacterium sp. Sd200]|uniref:T9SS sorting signal type C domain-containing protein n=1 Tax=Flavobacterium sp. Sd200 TaxID=2692211 RepID=UPI00136D3149